MINLPDLYSESLYNDFKDLAQKNGYECYTDLADNIIIHKSGRGKRVLIPFIADKEELLITSVKNKKAEFVSNLDIKYSDNTEIYSGINKVGKIIKEEEKHIELFKENIVKKGQKLYVVKSIECKDNKIYSRNIKADISVYLAKNLILENLNTDKDIYFTLSFSRKSAKVLVKALNPEYIFSISYDKPCKNFEISKGVGISFKENGFIISDEVLSLYKAASSDVLHQDYFGKSDSLTEYYYISKKDVKVGSLVLPIKYLDEPCEIATVDDINSAFSIYKNLLTNEV